MGAWIARPWARVATLWLPFLALAPHGLHATNRADAVAPFERFGIVPLPAGECQELRILRMGAGVLEVRFFGAPPPIPAGPDPKTLGASLLLAAADLGRPSFLLYDESGIYQRSGRVSEPIRWMRRGSELCVASGHGSAFCGTTTDEIRGTIRIAFGAGWKAEIWSCPAFAPHERSMGAWFAALTGFVALAGLALWSSRRPRDVVVVGVWAAGFAGAMIAASDPWRLPGVVLLPSSAIAGAVLVALTLLERRRSWAHRLPHLALGMVVVAALLRVPHPVSVRAPAEAVAPPLWLDSANWHGAAAHQSLAFRDRPLAGVVPGEEAWLVLGGSVVYGAGVEASQTFTAVAEALLRADGRRIVLLNAGAHGWNVQHIDRLLQDLGDALPVTGIVLSSILNNATLPIAGPRSTDCERSLVRAYLCNASRAQQLFTWPKVFLPKPHNRERYRLALRSLLERELRLGRRIVLLDEVGEIDEGALWAPEDYREIAREISAQLGVAFHPVTDAYEALAPADRFIDGIHPTPAAHALLGRKLYAILRDR